jgi:two-component system CheB/CheR fusion protein
MVSSFLKLLEKKYQGQLDETADKYIHYAVDGSERMKKLIMDLLAYSKVSTNDDVLTSTDMNALAADVLHIQQNKILELGATVTVGSLPTLENTRRTQMFQLLQNLVVNALKYHGQDPPVITINAREEADRWEFSVKDNGVGFEQKFAESVFIMFQRLHHRSEFAGTGIGLSICKKIVEMHHGNIWVESAPNEGSTFYFTIGK